MTLTILCKNKKALFEYEMLETFEAGLVLTGNEVKSIRSGSMSLRGAFVVVRHENNKAELYLINAHVAPYKMATKQETDAHDRSRKLLLHRDEMKSLLGRVEQKGLTLIPIKVYTSGSRIKLEFALAKGKKKFDKRESIKRRDTERQIRRALKLNRTY